jgi:hypothetical protein
MHYTIYVIYPGGYHELSNRRKLHIERAGGKSARGENHERRESRDENQIGRKSRSENHASRKSGMRKSRGEIITRNTENVKIENPKL